MLFLIWAGNEQHAHVAMVHCDSGGVFLSRAGQRRILGFIARREAYAQNRRGSALQRRMGARGCSPRRSSRDIKLRLGRNRFTAYRAASPLRKTGSNLTLSLELKGAVTRSSAGSASIADHQPDLLGFPSFGMACATPKQHIVHLNRSTICAWTPTSCAPGRSSRSGLRPQPADASHQLNIRNQLRTLRFGAKAHRGEDRAGGGGGANQHRYRKAHVPLGREI